VLPDTWFSPVIAPASVVTQVPLSLIATVSSNSNIVIVATASVIPTFVTVVAVPVSAISTIPAEQWSTPIASWYPTTVVVAV